MTATPKDSTEPRPPDAQGHLSRPPALSADSAIGGTVKWLNVEKGYAIVTPDDRRRDIFVSLNALGHAQRRRATPGERILLNKQAIGDDKAVISRAKVAFFDRRKGAGLLTLPGRSRQAYVDHETLRRSKIGELLEGEEVFIKVKNIGDNLIAMDVSRPRSLQPGGDSVPAKKRLPIQNTTFDQIADSSPGVSESYSANVAMQLLNRIEDSLDDMNESINSYFSNIENERTGGDGV
jgi:cold shock CspA family protein